MKPLATAKDPCEPSHDLQAIRTRALQAVIPSKRADIGCTRPARGCRIAGDDVSRLTGLGEQPPLGA